jgi:RNA polymerase II subunit A C-terminal domain phosphatase SSU72
MEAHHVLSRKGFSVDSYGTNQIIRIPGPAIDKPNVYQFGVTYEEIYQDLMKKDPQLYTQNGLLMLIDRNRKIKAAPQRFQESEDMYDVLITCEDRCFDMVCEDLMKRGHRVGKPVHVVNFDIKDNPEEATIAARSILQLAQRIEEAKCIDDEMEQIVDEFQSKSAHPMLYTVLYY